MASSVRKTKPAESSGSSRREVCLNTSILTFSRLSISACVSESRRSAPGEILRGSEREQSGIRPHRPVPRPTARRPALRSARRENCPGTGISCLAEMRINPPSVRGRTGIRPRRGARLITISHGQAHFSMGQMAQCFTRLRQLRRLSGGGWFKSRPRFFRSLVSLVPIYIELTALLGRSSSLPVRLGPRCSFRRHSRKQLASNRRIRAAAVHVVTSA